MHTEIPEIRRCCCCLPLRRGLIGWGYLKLANDILATTYIVSSIWPRNSLSKEDLIITLAIITYLSIDAAFTMFLIVGGHKKNPKLLRISYIYSIILLVLILTLGGLHVYVGIRVMLDMGNLRFVGFLLDVCVYFVIFCVQVYLILLIRSEAIKLRNENLMMQYTNHATDAESRCVCTDNGRNDDSVQ